MDSFFTKFKIFIGEEAKQYMDIIADSSEILGGIGDELY